MGSWKMPGFPKILLLEIHVVFYGEKFLLSIFIAPRFFYRTVKTALFYHVPIKSYSIHNRVHSILKRIVLSISQ